MDPRRNFGRITVRRSDEQSPLPQITGNNKPLRTSAVSSLRPKVPLPLANVGIGVKSNIQTTGYNVNRKQETFVDIPPLDLSRFNYNQQERSGIVNVRLFRPGQQSKSIKKKLKGKTSPTSGERSEIIVGVPLLYIPPVSPEPEPVVVFEPEPEPKPLPTPRSEKSEEEEIVANKEEEETKNEIVEKKRELTAEELYQEGERCNREGSFAHAAEFYRQAMGMGHIEAACDYALLHLNHDDLGVSKKEAFKLLMTLAEKQEHFRSQFNCAEYFRKGIESVVGKDLRKAIFYYEKAGDIGNMCVVMNEYGRSLEEKGKIEINNYIESKNKTIGLDSELLQTSKTLQEAFRLYEAAAKAGDSLGKYNCARCFMEGIGVKINQQIALDLLKDAAAQGHKESQLYYRTCLEQQQSSFANATNRATEQIQGQNYGTNPDFN